MTQQKPSTVSREWGVGVIEGSGSCLLLILANFIFSFKERMHLKRSGGLLVSWIVRKWKIQGLNYFAKYNAIVFFLPIIESQL